MTWFQYLKCFRLPDCLKLMNPGLRCTAGALALYLITAWWHSRKPFAGPALASKASGESPDPRPRPAFSDETFIDATATPLSPTYFLMK